MAPNWLSRRQSAWGLSSSGGLDLSKRVVAIGALVVFFLGLGGGYLLNGASASTTSGSSSGNTTLRSGAESGPQAAPVPVIDQNVELVSEEEQTPEGAVRAATAFLTGLGNVALQGPAERKSTLDDLLSPEMDPAARDLLSNNLGTLRTELLGPPGSERSLTAKFVNTPTSYSVQQQSDNQATVSVWMLSIFVEPTTQRVESTWTTSTVGLTWSDHWRIATYDRRLGPSPTLFTQNAQYSTFEDIVQVFNGYRAYRYATSG